MTNIITQKNNFSKHSQVFFLFSILYESNHEFLHEKSINNYNYQKFHFSIIVEN